MTLTITDYAGAAVAQLLQNAGCYTPAGVCLHPVLCQTTTAQIIGGQLSRGFHGHADVNFVVGLGAHGATLAAVTATALGLSPIDNSSSMPSCREHYPPSAQLAGELQTQRVLAVMANVTPELVETVSWLIEHCKFAGAAALGGASDALEALRLLCQPLGASCRVLQAPG